MDKKRVGRSLSYAGMLLAFASLLGATHFLNEMATSQRQFANTLSRFEMNLDLLEAAGKGSAATGTNTLQQAVLDRKNVQIRNLLQTDIHSFQIDSQKTGGSKFGFGLWLSIFGGFLAIALVFLAHRSIVGNAQNASELPVKRRNPPVHARATVIAH